MRTMSNISATANLAAGGRKSAALLTVLLTAAAVSFAYGKEDKESPYPEAPDFRLTSTDGSVVELTDYEGKVVLINFWATWCAPCRWEIPELVSLYNEHKADGVVVIGIAVQSGSMEKVREFAESLDITYLIVSGNAVEVGRVVLDYGGFQSIPTTFLIDRDGRVRGYYVGPRPKETFWQDIKPLL